MKKRCCYTNIFSHRKDVRDVNEIDKKVTVSITVSSVQKLKTKKMAEHSSVEEGRTMGG